MSELVDLVRDLWGRLSSGTGRSQGSADIVVAAGGILWRKTARRRECAAVHQAAQIRDEHYHNQACKDRLVRTQILSLALVLAAVLGGLLGTVWSARLPLQVAAADGFSTFVGVALFGFLGGTVSAMLRASDTDLAARIPETTAAFRVTFMRVFMGGASAVVIDVFIRSQLPGILNEELVTAIAHVQPYTAYAIAFAAGFTERFVLRAVEQVAGKEQPGKEAKKR